MKGVPEKMAGWWRMFFCCLCGEVGEVSNSVEFWGGGGCSGIQKPVDTHCASREAIFYFPVAGIQLKIKLLIKGSNNLPS